MKRRYAIASLAVMAANLKDIMGINAQVTVTNDSQIVSTGDVYVEQAAQGSQDIDYRPITGGKGCDTGSVRYDFGYQSLIVCNEKCEWHLLNLDDLECRRGCRGR